MGAARFDQVMKDIKGKDDERYNFLYEELKKLTEEALETNQKRTRSNEKQIKRYKILNYVLQGSILIATASIPVLVFFETLRPVSVIVGSIDTVLVGLVNISRFKEHRFNLEQTNQRLLQEHNSYKTFRGDYDIPFGGEALELFEKRTEQINNECLTYHLNIEKSIPDPATLFPTNRGSPYGT